MKYRLTKKAYDRIRQEKKEKKHQGQYKEVESGVFIK